MTVKKTPSGRPRRKPIGNRSQRALIPLVAAGGSLAALPAGAIELGEAVVESHLGQPLRASIAYALAPHEQIADTCVSVGRTRSAAGLPGG